MHPNVKKYKQFIDFLQGYEAECKVYEKELRAFQQEVEAFQKTVDTWSKSNVNVVQHMQVPESNHANHLIEVMKKGTALSLAMTQLYELEKLYLNSWTAFSQKLLEMSSNKSPEHLIANLPKLKDFSKRNHKVFNEKISELKKEAAKVDALYKELKTVYNQNLN